MSRIKMILFVFMAISLMACHKQKPDWPEYMSSNLWVSPDAYQVNHTILNGTYQVEYNVKVCHPARSFIDTMVSEMSGKKWKRLDYDINNPGLRLNHSRPERVLWGMWQDQDNTVLQWMDEWEDQDNNVVIYGLKYIVKQLDFKNACVLNVVVIYIPTELRKK